MNNKHRIGTISINTHTYFNNYGAILHSWAFQQYLDKLVNVESVEIIDYTIPILEKYNLKYPFINYFRNLMLKSFLKSVILYPQYRRRYNKIQKFIEENMMLSSKHYVQKTLAQEKFKYDTLVCESDVIWSDGFFDKAFFLAFHNMKNMKKIAYAPSMSDGNLKEEQKAMLPEYLKCIDFISVRESYAVNILKNYTTKEIKHVLDPVLLLEEEEYTNIIAKPLTTEKYLLLYLPADDNQNLRKFAEQYAASYKLQIIEISSKQKISFTHKTIITAGIEEFLSLIKYADIIFTNSFHAVCFSVIFNKEFYAFSRAFAGKVKDVCELLGLEDRYFSDDNFTLRNPINYDEINSIWRQKREESEAWLNYALNYEK